MSKGVDHESATALAIARGDMSKVTKQDVIEHSMLLGQMAGRIETANMFARFGDIATLMWLRQVKESKAYKLIGTWEKFCKNIKLDRRTVDERLQDLDIFGEAFLETVANLGLGYRQMRELRQISHDGGVSVVDGVVLIGGDEIPLDAEHAKDLEDALKRVVDDAQGEARAANRLAKEKETRIKGYIKKLDKLERKAEQRGIPEGDIAFSEYMDRLLIGFKGWAVAASVQAMEEEAEEMTPGKRASLLNTCKEMRDYGELIYQQAVDKYGAGLTEKGNIWRPGKR